MGKYLLFLSSILHLGVVLAAPSGSSLVVSLTEPSFTREKKDATTNSSLQSPKIYEIHITSNILNRYATTLVVSKVKNVDKVAKETTFTVVLPEKAFISEFVMEIDGKRYKAYVKEKEEADQIYDQAVASGHSAGHVAVSVRDSNKFTVSVNVEPQAKIVFLLTYEELLVRRNDQYELIVNIHPGQIVKNLNVKVQIDDTIPLTFVRTPSLRTGNEIISKNKYKLDPFSDIRIVNKTSAVVKFNPDSKKQTQFALNLGNEESNSLSGQFVVQYDVRRDPHAGQVLFRDGYFVHFLAPRDLEPLPKHVIFVLDSSLCMWGSKTAQVKNAMHSILDKMREDDLISVINFGKYVLVWDIKEGNRRKIALEGMDYENPFATLSKLKLPAPIEATKENLEKAKRLIGYSNFGEPFMIGSLETALYLAKRTQNDSDDNKYQPIMIFLTNGEPKVGLRSKEEIIKIVTRINSENINIPIFSLSFGTGPDREFLKKLSLKNQGSSRHIYVASDASLQLQEFFKQISSPLLSNVTFKYNNDVKEVSKTTFPVFFKGSEMIVAGRYDVSDSEFQPPEEVSCWAITGSKTLKPTVQKSESSLERLWAYLTVKQTLDERELSDNKEKLTNKALDLSLKYSFMTDVTSLMVVKPNKTSAVNTEGASSEDNSYNSGDKYHSTASDAHLGNSILAEPRSQHGLTLFGKRGPTIPNNILLPLFDVDSPRFNDISSVVSHIRSISYSILAVVPDLPSKIYGPITVAQNDLSWLVAVLNPNKTITVAEKSYELGGRHAEDSGSPKPCTNTWGNETQSRQCVLLRDCPELSSVVRDFLTYQQYFCPIDETYAGICCSKEMV